MKTLTLIDKLQRETLRAHPTLTMSRMRSPKVCQKVLESAVKFIVDERMSAFMADLAFGAFMGKSPRVQERIGDSLRLQARLPSETIWIEYRINNYENRSAELLGVPKADRRHEANMEGWLIQQHPVIDTAYLMHAFVAADENPKYPEAYMLPFAFAWTSDDSPLPWRKIGHAFGVCVSGAMFGMGTPYHRENVDVVSSPLINDFVVADEKDHRMYKTVLEDWAGIGRRVWSLLATLDNLPITYKEVRPAKGFFARGRIRQFYSHKTITLNVPEKKDMRIIARKAIAHAHRKRHEVRGHWRNDFRHPLGACNPHLWEAIDNDADRICCSQCHGRQTFIHKHERGDKSLGYVWHDYNLKHETAE